MSSNRIPNPSLSVCKSCGNPSHSRKSHFLCPQNPRNLSRAITSAPISQTSRDPPLPIVQTSPQPESLSTESPTSTLSPDETSTPSLLSQTLPASSTDPSPPPTEPRRGLKGLNFTDHELSALAQLVRHLKPVDGAEWLPLASQYNTWARANNFQERTSTSLA